MTFLKYLSACAAGAFALGLSAAMANHPRPDHCDIDHDHRSHASNYYDYYPADKYYRSGRGGVSVTVRAGSRYDPYYDRGRRYDDYRYSGRRNGYRGRSARVVHRETFRTRYRARIVLTEELVRRGRYGPQLICTVQARGPEARYVPERRMYRIAHRNCSPRARIRVYA